MWSMALKNSKPQRFLCKSRERFIIIVAQRQGIYVDGDKPIPKKKNKPIKGLGGGDLLNGSAKSYVPNRQLFETECFFEINMV